VFKATTDLARKPWNTREVISKKGQRKEVENVNNEEERNDFRRLSKKLKKNPHKTLGWLLSESQPKLVTSKIQALFKCLLRRNIRLLSYLRGFSNTSSFTRLQFLCKKSEQGIFFRQS
jgi:hypothetical protein